MTFGEALENLKQGKKITREGWNGKNQYLGIASNISFIDLNGKEINSTHETMGNKAIVFYGTSGIQVGWLASQSDLLSEDWKVIE